MKTAATASIVLIPPTHEQSVFSFHVEESLAPGFLAFLKAQGLTPWRPPVALDKDGADGEQLVQLEFESNLPQDQLEALVEEYQERM